MKVGLIVLLVALLGGSVWLLSRSGSSNSVSSISEKVADVVPFNRNNLDSSEPSNAPDVEVVAENLDTPWGIAFLPDGSMLVTERQGTVRYINNNGELTSEPIARIQSAREIGEGGLLGIVLHPQFSSNNYVYLYYTFSESGGNTQNRVSRFTYTNNQLTNEQIILDNIPGASNHNGGRIKFGPDGYLYVGTGDAQDPSRAQDTNSLAGKILRITDNGDLAPGNPFQNAVYTYGHRNIQGLAWDESGQLWATEHGRSGVQSGLDELNKIEIGKNYGWPEIQGDETRNGMEKPFLHSGSNTWAPSGLAFLEGSFYFGGLRGQSLYEVSAANKNLTDHFAKSYGRIRDVVVEPDNMLYITTSNKDGRGSPVAEDDRILRINPAKL